MKKQLLIFTSLFSMVFFACGGPTQESGQNNEETADKEEQTTADESAGTGEEPYVFFVNLKDGDEISSPFKVEMGVKGMEIEPAGQVVEGKGHHHLLINDDFVEAGVIVPADERHIHFGLGQTETELELEPGSYTLSLQFADGVHASFGKKMSASINIVVK